MTKRGRIGSSSGSKSILTSNNNNFLGSLLSSLTFGIFDIHNCDSDDESWYCKFSRFFGALIKIIVLGIIIYGAYIIFFTRNTKGGKSKLKIKN